MTATEGRCWPLWSRTTKQASNSSADQGGGKRPRSGQGQVVLELKQVGGGERAGGRVLLLDAHEGEAGGAGSGQEVFDFIGVLSGR
jgi:hypothetical protein